MPHQICYNVPIFTIPDNVQKVSHNLEMEAARQVG